MKYIPALIIIFVISSCASKNAAVIEQEDPDDILSVYYRLIEGIKYRNYDVILSCYSPDAEYSYDKNTGEKFKCYNNEKKVTGSEQIKEQYRYMFKKNILDRIEFEIIKADPDRKNPNIKYLNVWQNTDDDIVEMISFTRINGKYYISTHRVMKK